MTRGGPLIGRRALLAALLATGAVAGIGRSGMTFAHDSVTRRRDYVASRWGQLHMHVAGPADPALAVRPPLVCFHPTPYSGAFFREFQTLMAVDRIVLCPDTPGFGGSDGPPAPATMTDYGLAVADALRALGYGTGGRGALDALGFHTGCLIATEVAIEAPDLVRRLVLPGMPYYRGAEQREKLERYHVEKPYYEDPSALARVWQERHAAQGAKVATERLLELLGEELRAGRRSHWPYRAVFTYPGDERLPRVGQPALLVATSGELFEPTRRAAALMPRAELVELPDVSTPVFNAHHDTVATVVRDWLDDCKCAAPSG
jgi:pimeloyl-ACP methyl ester carboxylesterase